MTTASFGEDFNFKFQNAETMKAIQKMIHASTAPAREAMQESIRQITADSFAGVMDSLRPVFAEITADAVKSTSKIIVPTFDIPKFELTLGSFRQITLGDAAARDVVSSLDYYSIAHRVSVEPKAKVLHEITEIEPGELTEQSLDELTADLFERHPDLAERFHNDPAITTLNSAQQKMLAWQWALAILFGLALLFAGATVDKNVAFVASMTTTAVPFAAAGYAHSKKVMGSVNETASPQQKDGVQ